MLRLARPLSTAARRQILTRSVPLNTRSYAERKDGILSSDPAFLPGSQSEAAPVKTEIPLGPGGPGAPAPSPSSTSSAPTIPAQNIPRVPPTPEQVQATPPPAVKPTVIPPSPPPARPRRFRRLRLLFYLLLTGALGYGGAVFYALRSDNFHDFFTEYIPFGEDAVLYFEERSFRKRFPNARLNTYRNPSEPKSDEAKVTIPWKSGLSWRVADESKTDAKAGDDTKVKTKSKSAVDAKTPDKSETKEAQQDPSGATAKEKVAAVERAKSGSQSKSTSTNAPAVIAAKDEPKAQAPTVTTKSTDTRPPLIAPVTQISPLQVANADEPVVQEIVKVINDLITVINADNTETANKYSSPMQKAKDSLASVATKIGALKEAERNAAKERIEQAHREFDEGAKVLLQRIETAQREDDVRYREEFESERAKIAEQYETRLQTEIQRTKDIAEQQLRNELAEQAIEMKRHYIKDIKSLVETERDGRLSKLSDLSTNVDSLTELTSNWNGVIDINLATQKLQVAVDAVRSALQSSNLESKPAPFVREMAALKLVAEGDPIVEAAIAAINPQAYQKGLPSSSQLIDRFRRVATEVRKASLLPEDAGIASHAASVVLSKVMFKKQGQPEGNDVESILTRTESMLEEGDLDAAAREVNGLDGWAGVLSRDWLNDVRKVLEVRQALDVIETEARLQCLRVE